MYLEMLYNRYGAGLEKQAGMEKQAIYLSDLVAGSLGAVLGGVGSYAANPNTSKKQIALTGGLSGLAGFAGSQLLNGILERSRIGPKTRLLAKLGVLSAPAIGGYLAEKIRSRGANN